MKQIFKQKRPRILLLFLIATLPFLFGIAYMIGFNQKAIAAVMTDTTTSSNGSSTFSINVGNNPNRILVVGGSGNITSVTDNTTATPYTKLLSYTGPKTGARVNLFYLKDPAPGTHTITVVGGKSGGASSFYNVDLSNPFQTSSSNNALDTTKGYENTGYSSGGNSTDSFFIAGANTTPGQLALGIVKFVTQAAPAPATITVNTSPTYGQQSLWTSSPSSFDGAISIPVINNGNINYLLGVTYSVWQMTNSFGTYGWVGYVVGINPVAPTPTPTQVPTATPTPIPTPVQTQGNVVNLNFGITNANPWIQVVCGDIRIDNGIINPAPAGQSLSIINSNCTEPGIVFSGDGTPSFGQGQASSTNQVVGGTTYPEVYSPSNSGGIFSSYAYLSAKSETADKAVINLETICTLSSCTLPSALPSGVYYAQGDVYLNQVMFLPDRQYVFLVDGDLYVRGDVLTPIGSSTVFSVSGDIIVPATVGSPLNSTAANLSGIFSTDKSFVLESNNNCTDLRLNIEGTLIVNAARTGGRLENNRDLCGGNATTPALRVTQRLDFVLNLPELVRFQQTTLEEVAP